MTTANFVQNESVANAFRLGMFESFVKVHNLNSAKWNMNVHIKTR